MGQKFSPEPERGEIEGRALRESSVQTDAYWAGRSLPIKYLIIGAGSVLGFSLKLDTVGT